MAARLSLCLLAGLLLVGLASAQSIQVKKSAPGEIELGQVLEVTIRLVNQEASALEVTVTENLGDAQTVDPKPIVPTPEPNIIAVRLPYFEWKRTLAPNAENTIVYKIKPNKVGTYAFSATTVRTNDGRTFFSNDLSTTVRSQSSGICEPAKGENYLTAPNKCPSGGVDNYCDQIIDGKCDPDCTPEADLDCLCGNNKCDVQFGENFKTCSKDCPSGGADKYCDGKADNICDPDCTPETDPDCKPVVGGPGLSPVTPATETKSAPSATPSPKQPGFEMAVALAAILVVALRIRRR